MLYTELPKRKTRSESEIRKNHISLKLKLISSRSQPVELARRLMFSFPRRMPSDDYQFRQFSHVHFLSFSCFTLDEVRGDLLILRAELRSAFQRNQWSGEFRFSFRYLVDQRIPRSFALKSQISLRQRKQLTNVRYSRFFTAHNSLIPAKLKHELYGLKSLFNVSRQAIIWEMLVVS